MEAILEGEPVCSRCPYQTRKAQYFVMSRYAPQFSRRSLL